MRTMRTEEALLPKERLQAKRARWWNVTQCFSWAVRQSAQSSHNRNRMKRKKNYYKYNVMTQAEQVGRRKRKQQRSLEFLNPHQSGFLESKKHGGSHKHLAVCQQPQWSKKPEKLEEKSDPEMRKRQARILETQPLDHFRNLLDTSFVHLQGLLSSQVQPKDSFTRHFQWSNLKINSCLDPHGFSAQWLLARWPHQLAEPKSRKVTTPPSGQTNKIHQT